MTDRIPDVGIGTYENSDPEVCAESVATALDAGYRHVDTAEMYGNEAAVGEGIARADVDREDVFVATKIDSSNLAYDDALASAEACLDRLGVESVDLLYVHWPIRTYDPEETLAAFDELYDRGLVRNVGLSNFTPDLLDEAIDRLDAPLAAHQVECHPLLPQDELRAHADEHGYRLVAYSPLAKGRVLEMPELVELAEENDATPAEVSLAWLLAKGAAVIPKSSSSDHIRENLAARDLTLDAEELARIDAIDHRERQVDFDAAPWN
ncbi:aldo/keto reductase [Halostella litorea]|uniref:aldo/keto reductase n=1 Tax=Halostella litorea TaxID=2528831 RepID=UPI0010933356|nr:aldo/keto reductase [Halostella litorea]